MALSTFPAPLSPSPRERLIIDAAGRVGSANRVTHEKASQAGSLFARNEKNFFPSSNGNCFSPFYYIKH